MPKTRRRLKRPRDLDKTVNIWTPPWFLFLAALIFCGCAGTGVVEKSPPEEVKAFFTAGNEAVFRGLRCAPAGQVDLSAYAAFMGVKYPPTDSVEVLSQPPSRPYQTFAVLQYTESSAPSASGNPRPGVLAQFIAKAKAIGADAIIMRQTPDCPTGVEAVAIKYRLEVPGGKKGSPSPKGG
jgi:hypothetical protein